MTAPGFDPVTSFAHEAPMTYPEAIDALRREVAELTRRLEAVEAERRIPGPTGPTGATGCPGAMGPTGWTGATGATGGLR